MSVRTGFTIWSSTQADSPDTPHVLDTFYFLLSFIKPALTTSLRGCSASDKHIPRKVLITDKAKWFSPGGFVLKQKAGVSN